MTDTPDAEPPDVDPWSTVSRRLPALESMADEKPLSGRRRFLRRFRRQWAAVAALATLLILTWIAVFAPWIAPHDPLAQDLSNVLQPPSGENLLGTDELGRDVLSRLILGSRVSLLAAAEATAIAFLIGVPGGVIAGYQGGWIDRAIMMVTDAIMSLPALILAIAIIGVMGPNLTNTMAAVGVVFSPRVLRLTRSSVLEVRQETHIEASRSIGTRTSTILRRHVLPNALSPLIVFGALLAGRAMIAEASLSFIGLGVQPPQASWGAMLGKSFRYISRSKQLIVWPGIAVAATVFAFNLLADGIRDSLGRDMREVPS